MNITNETKKQIIESELAALQRQEYQLELQCRAFKATDQEDQLEVRTQMLVKTKAQIDFYEKELKGLKTETKK